MRVGLVGAGGVGLRHARTLAGFEDVELVGVTDPVPAAAEAVAGETGTVAVPRLADLLAEDLDAVWICVPPFAHGEPERACLDAGLPFFVEKPLAAALPLAEEIAAAVATAGLPTATGYHWRHLDTVARAAHLLATRPPRLLTLSWQDKVPPPAWWSAAASSGGQVVEQATHVLDVARVLAGEVVEVSAVAAPSSADGRDVADGTAALLRFASGAVGTLGAACTPAVKARAGLDVAAAGLFLELTETALRVTTADGVEERTPAVDARTAVDRAFVDALSGGPPAPGMVDYTQALQTHRVACAVAESARTGAVVRVEER